MKHRNHTAYYQESHYIINKLPEKIIIQVRNQLDLKLSIFLLLCYQQYYCQNGPDCGHARFTYPHRDRVSSTLQWCQPSHRHDRMRSEIHTCIACLWGTHTCLSYMSCESNHVDAINGKPSSNVNYTSPQNWINHALDEFTENCVINHYLIK